MLVVSWRGVRGNLLYKEGSSPILLLVAPFAVFFSEHSVEDFAGSGSGHFVIFNEVHGLGHLVAQLSWSWQVS